MCIRSPYTKINTLVSTFVLSMPVCPSPCAVCFQIYAHSHKSRSAFLPHRRKSRALLHATYPSDYWRPPSDLLSLSPVLRAEVAIPVRSGVVQVKLARQEDLLRTDRGLRLSTFSNFPLTSWEILDSLRCPKREKTLNARKAMRDFAHPGRLSMPIAVLSTTKTYALSLALWDAAEEAFDNKAEGGLISTC